MLAIGSRAPEFTLADQDGRDLSLSNFLNHGMVVLYFYPADFTRDCTRQACVIRDMHDEIVKARLTVVGVSPQQPQRHQEFRLSYQLPFTLLADPDKTIIRLYEARGPLGFGVRRITYLIDRDRTIRDAVEARFDIDRHEELIRRALSTRA